MGFPASILGVDSNNRVCIPPFSGDSLGDGLEGFLGLARREGVGKDNAADSVLIWGEAAQHPAVAASEATVRPDGNSRIMPAS